MVVVDGDVVSKMESSIVFAVLVAVLRLLLLVVILLIIMDIFVLIYVQALAPLQKSLGFFVSFPRMSLDFMAIKHNRIPK